MLSACKRAAALLIRTTSFEKSTLVARGGSSIQKYSPSSLKKDEITAAISGSPAMHNALVHNRGEADKFIILPVFGFLRKVRRSTKSKGMIGKYRVLIEKT
jgi:hypothetical protein